MPIISAGVHIPGTNIGIGLTLAHQTPAEKEADAATQISDEAARERNAGVAEHIAKTDLDRLMEQNSPLDRFGKDA
jgi:hypothetical protein